MCAIVWYHELIGDYCTETLEVAGYRHRSPYRHQFYQSKEKDSDDDGDDDSDDDNDDRMTLHHSEIRPT